MQLDLTAEESAALTEVLDRALSTLREEIYKAEVAEYKTRLKQRETVLSNLLRRLGTPPVPSS
jgi:hypothetical protein